MTSPLEMLVACSSAATPKKPPTPTAISTSGSTRGGWVRTRRDTPNGVKATRRRANVVARTTSSGTATTTTTSAHHGGRTSVGRRYAKPGPVTVPLNRLSAR